MDMQQRSRIRGRHHGDPQRAVFDSEKAHARDRPSATCCRTGASSRSGRRDAKRKARITIDAAGRVLLPGLFDMHAHASFWDGGLHIAAGITTVRDMGNDNETLQQLIGAGEGRHAADAARDPGRLHRGREPERRRAAAS